MRVRVRVSCRPHQRRLEGDRVEARVTIRGIMGPGGDSGLR